MNVYFLTEASLKMFVPLFFFFFFPGEGPSKFFSRFSPPQMINGCPLTLNLPKNCSTLKCIFLRRLFLSVCANKTLFRPLEVCRHSLLPKTYKRTFCNSSFIFFIGIVPTLLARMTYIRLMMLLQSYICIFAK